MSTYLTISGQSSGELTVERSRFIAAARHVESEKEALDFIAEKKAEYHDAKHNCYAYVLRDGISRFSDDGEPHSTAGKPMLEIIEGEKIYDVCVVVTRYFGGVLLGTGGLVRAYSSATREALASAVRLSLEECAVYEIVCPYSDYDYIQKIIAKSGKIESSDFTDCVKIITAVKQTETAVFEETLEKTFRDRINFKKIGEKVLPV